MQKRLNNMVMAVVVLCAFGMVASTSTSAQQPLKVFVSVALFIFSFFIPKIIKKFRS